MQRSIGYRPTIFNFRMNILSHIWSRIILSGKNNRGLGIAPILFALPIIGWVIAEGSVKSFQILVLLIVFLFFLWVLMKPHIGVLGTIVFIFIPVSIGNLFRIPHLQVAEAVIPSITIVYFLSKILKRKPIFVFKRSMNPFLIPILLYFGVIFTNYLRNPLPPSSIVGIPQELGGLRIYYRFFLGFCGYLLFAEAVSLDMKIIPGIKGLLWQICLILFLLGIVLIYSYPAQNILYNLQSHEIFSSDFFSAGGPELLETRYRLGSGGYRIGTLGEACSICLLLLLAGARKVNGVLKWIFYGLLWSGLILSGWRSGFVGTILAFCLGLIIQKRWKAFPLLFAAGFIIYMCVFVYYDILPLQMQRILQIRGPLETLDAGRGMIFPIFWSSFLENPVFGVSMGSVEISGTGMTRFVTQQLRFGGHGTYLSLLYTTGLAGFIPFVWIYLSGIKTSLFIVNHVSTRMVRTLSLFCLLYLIHGLVALSFGGHGASLRLFMIFGVISGLYLYQRCMGSAHDRGAACATSESPRML